MANARWALAVLCAAGSAAAQGPKPTYQDVAYGSHPLERMDLYRAPGVGRSPVVIEVHGGGWVSGTKSDFALQYADAIEAILARGISVASIEYPLAPADPFPHPNRAVQRAVQFVRSQASRWGLDPEAVGAIGFSAGGHLALWAALAPDAADPGSPDPVARESSRLRAVVALAAATDLTEAAYQQDPNYVQFGSAVFDYFGVANEAAYLALPASVKLAASPRWLVSHGAGLEANARVAFLGIYPGKGKETKPADAPSPTPDLHSVLFGLLLVEALEAATVHDAALWIGPSLTSPLGSLGAREALASWLEARLRDGGVRNYGAGTAGCPQTELLTSEGLPIVGNTRFSLRAHGGKGGAPAALLLSDLALPDGPDPAGLGVRMLVNPFTPLLLVFESVHGADGVATFDLPIPPIPQLSGKRAYFQALSFWKSLGSTPDCNPSVYGLASTNGIEVTFR